MAIHHQISSKIQHAHIFSSSSSSPLPRPKRGGDGDPALDPDAAATATPPSTQTPHRSAPSLHPNPRAAPLPPPPPQPPSGAPSLDPDTTAVATHMRRRRRPDPQRLDPILSSLSRREEKLSIPRLGMLWCGVTTTSRRRPLRLQSKRLGGREGDGVGGREKKCLRLSYGRCLHIVQAWTLWRWI